MIKYYLSSTKFTVQVNTDDRGYIIWGAPIVLKFINQHIDKLARWMDADQIIKL